MSTQVVPEFDVPLIPAHVGEIAWVLIELLYVASYVQRAGRCMGELRPSHVRLGPWTVRRSEGGSAISDSLDAFLVRFHERWLHDRGCVTLGMSERVLHRWLRRWGRKVPGTRLIGQALNDAFAETETMRGGLVAEIFAWKISSIVTPVAPQEKGAPPAS